MLFSVPEMGSLRKGRNGMGINPWVAGILQSTAYVGGMERKNYGQIMGYEFTISTCAGLKDIVQLFCLRVADKINSEHFGRLHSIQKNKIFSCLASKDLMIPTALYQLNMFILGYSPRGIQKILPLPPIGLQGKGWSVALRGWMVTRW